ncbi:uncharacterized protein LOC130622541 [Hydractinia symbiolongicarpus]|uniref:uncharacterized protein LOC130622541 n=1 Tax=Hydractinia symbiolongicarpus TaxID=13093 RepID=UPI00255034F8|nr:uncharacterized protein LOC130622541 [Hydractinia symbiolongicarpus]
MVSRILSILVSLLFIKYILSNQNIYVIHSVNCIGNGKITNYAKRQLRTSCLLNCGNDKNCDKAFYKPEEGNSMFGECWFVKEEGGNEVDLLQNTVAAEIETFQDVSYCGRNTCKYGRCENTNTEAQHICHCDYEDWKLQATNVCFGAKNDSYGNFTLRDDGILTKLKLHHNGDATLNCNFNQGVSHSRWGCAHYATGLLGIAITNEENIIMFPNPPPIHFTYNLPGYNDSSPFIVFQNYNIPAKIDDEFRIWYLEDFGLSQEDDNSGRSCTDVYAVFCD